MAFNDTNLSTVWNGYEIWFLTLRKEHRLTAFENRAMRKKGRFKRKGVTVGWKENNIMWSINVYMLQHILLVWIYPVGMRWLKHVICMTRSERRIWFGLKKLKVRDKLKKARSRWESNIKMGLTNNTVGQGMDWSLSRGAIGRHLWTR